MRIKFQGQEFLLIGDKETGGAIATQEAYENFDPSFAHLFPDGRILRHKSQIGTLKDIEFLSEEGK